MKRNLVIDTMPRIWKISKKHCAISKYLVLCSRNFHFDFILFYWFLWPYPVFEIYGMLKVVIKIYASSSTRISIFKLTENVKDFLV